MKWADKKKCITDALKKNGYNENKVSGNWQKSVPFEDNMRIATVFLKTQPKQGEHIPVVFINPNKLDEKPSEKDIDTVLESTKHVIRAAINKLESKQKDEKQAKPDEPTKHDNDIKTIKESNNVPVSLQPIAVQLTGPIKLSIDVIQEYINVDATREQAFNFMAFCEAHNLDPFKQEAHLIIYGGKASNVIGVDGNIKRAQEQHDYDGYIAGIIVKKEDGNIDEREGTFLLEEETLLGGWCKVFRKKITHPFVSKVTLNEYIQLKKDGTPNKIWNTKPASMIAKVPISQCHRKAYAGLNGGGYEQIEMKDLGDVEVIE